MKWEIKKLILKLYILYTLSCCIHRDNDDMLLLLLFVFILYLFYVMLSFSSRLHSTCPSVSRFFLYETSRFEAWLHRFSTNFVCNLIFLVKLLSHFMLGISTIPPSIVLELFKNFFLHRRCQSIKNLSSYSATRNVYRK